MLKSASLLEPLICVLQATGIPDRAGSTISGLRMDYIFLQEMLVMSKSSQNPYFSVTHLLSPQNRRLGFCRISVFLCPGTESSLVFLTVFSTAARRLVQTNFEYTVVLFIYISKYLTKSNFMPLDSVHWKHRPRYKSI